MLFINSILYISWDVSPNLYEGFITLRYYSLFFALSFILGFILVKKMYLKEGAPVEWMDKLLVYAVFGTIIGARLGHVLFYEPSYYFQNPLEIVMIWKGGLASHGAAIALVIAMYLYSRKVTKKHIFWSLDKLVIAVALAAGFIRMGNLMNSEIIGMPSENLSSIFYEYTAKDDLPNSLDNFIIKEEVTFSKTTKSFLKNEFNYPIANLLIPIKQNIIDNRTDSSIANYIINNYSIKDSESHFFTDTLSLNFSYTNGMLSIPVLIIPRVPTQLIEALCYWITFLVLLLGYWKWKWSLYPGRLFGLFLIMLFTSRFFIEFFKEHQALNEVSMLNMGQFLSIPCVLIGFYFIFKAKKA